MFKFLHTADWQMGMMAPGLGQAAPKARAARLESLRNVLKKAKEHSVDAILVAGDSFEDNQVAQSIVETVAGLLNDETRIPIYLIPGNHDPFTRDSVYRRPIWGQLRDHIHIVTTPQRIELSANVALFPCPLARKNGADDPTACIPPRGNGDNIRIGLAHGTMRIRDDVGDDDFPIPPDVAARRDLDYLALGHWHSVLSDPSKRAWYSGTHEVTSFGERDSGNCLIATFQNGNSPPQVDVVHTGVLSYQEYVIDLDQVALPVAMRKLREFTDASHTLLRVILKGQADAATTAQLPDLLAILAQRFLYHKMDESGLRQTSLASGLPEVASAPYLRQTMEQLLASANGQGTVSIAPEVARRAAQILSEVAWAQHRPQE